MFAKLQRICVFHIKSNMIYYILILCGFICGGIVAASCVFGISDLSDKELALYFGDFFASINQTGTNSPEIFKMAAFSNIKLYVVVILLSMMVIGSPFIALLSAFFGYSFWFTLLFVIKSYGVRSLLFFVGGMLPHQIIMFPCFALTLINSMKFSVSLLEGKNDVKSRIVPYVLKMLLLFAVSLLSSLLQGYIEPMFLEIMSPLFLGA